ncbi:phosphatase PAP2 family protein [uncultured Tateyamaria sp.]|uniref:phosphatase PAP2 family protein n=1 Tax=uncultured Tateyamaria sp. TaxID=455651 RepID=UPI002608D808|nr:phosphatase PAP2 family protein [uncultured Tateyamaria sp.]
MSLAAYVGHGGHGGHGGFSGPASPLSGTNPAQIGEFGYNFASAPHSPMLSNALRVARGAIIRDGRTEVDGDKFPTAEPNSSSLEHLDMYPRSAVVDWELLSGLDLATHLNADPDQEGDRVILSHRTTDGTTMPFLELIAPGRDVFAKQLVHVGDAAGEREERFDEINIQLADLLSFYTGLTFIHPARQPHVMEFVRSALRFCVLVEFRIKHAFTRPRPVAFSSSVMPIIQTPSHSTLPSGHATEAFFLATLFKHFYSTSGAGDADKHAGFCNEMAVRIAHNRTVAGVHFPVDSAAGAVLGTALANYVLARFSANGTDESQLKNQKCDTRKYGGARFDYADYVELAAQRQPLDSCGPILSDVQPAEGVTGIAEHPLALNPQLNWLWGKCVTELQHSQYTEDDG